MTIKTSADGLPQVSHDDADDEGEATRVGKVGSSPASPREVQQRPCFIVISGPNVGAMYPVNQAEMLIGRAQTVALRLEDDGVSRKHARVLQEQSGVTIEDLESANGTFVNGDAVAAPRKLLDGDKITIGATTILKFTYADDLEQTFQKKMYEAALRDGLTGAFNKRHFLDRIAIEFAYAKRHTTLLSLVMLDIDHFKKINDSYGHPVGDAVLVHLAKLVLGVIRQEDIFARYGGEEFAIICRGVSASQAATLAERLRNTMAASPLVDGTRSVPVTISLGVASTGDAMASADALIAAADGALYEAKRMGRNRVVSKA